MALSISNLFFWMSDECTFASSSYLYPVGRLQSWTTLGMYKLDNIQADTIVATIKDVLVQPAYEQMQKTVLWWS